MGYLPQRSSAFGLLLFAALAGPLRATELGVVAGSVSAADGTPIARATVTLQSVNATHSVHVDANGHFALNNLTPGVYAASASASAYNPLAPRPINVRGGKTTALVLTLARSSTSLTTIGTVSTTGNSTISTSSVPTQVLNTQTYAARGYTRVSDILQDALSTTVIRQGGGNPATPQSVALRGPDPTETLVDIDGHEVNNSNSGDFDLSLLDPADLEGVQLVYGIAPSSLIGPSSIGGAINVRTLEPTAKPHGLLRLSTSTFGAFGSTISGTGTADRLGYAVSLHRTTTPNEVDGVQIMNAQGDSSVVGSAVDADSALAKLRYSFGAARTGYVQLSFRDQTAVRDVSAALTSIQPAVRTAVTPSAAIDDARARVNALENAGVSPRLIFNGFAGSALFDHNAGYGLDLQVPVRIDSDGVATTTALYRHLTSLAAQSVTGPANGISPYYYNDRDRLAEDTLEVDHRFSTATLAFKFRLRSELLDTENPSNTSAVTDQTHLVRTDATNFFAESAAQATARDTLNGLGQTERSLALRLTYDPTPQFHYTAATYYSSFSSFGQSFDPRLGTVWTPNASTALRASAGTTFQAPQLTELYIPPVLPQPDANGHVDIGNPNLKADHATEYDVGLEQLVGAGDRATRLSVDVYRTNLRTPSQRYRPGAICDPGKPEPACESYPVNIGNAVYTGAELRAEHNVDRRTVVRLGFGITSAYPRNVPAEVQSGSLLPGEQFLGVPLHKATLSVQHSAETGFSYNATLLYEGRYNELNQPPFTTLAAGVDWSWHDLLVSLHATNITDVYDTKFTHAGFGVPYGGVAGPILTDAYALQGPEMTLSIARHF